MEIVDSSMMFMNHGQIRSNLFTFANLCGTAIAITAIGLTATVATANQTEVILRTGQKMPGDPSQQPLENIQSFGIDSQQNVVAIVNTKTYDRLLGTSYKLKTTFQGIYRLAPGKTPQLLDSGEVTAFNPFTDGQQNTQFKSPSISLGQVSYFKGEGGVSAFPLFYELKFGVPGAVNRIAASGPLFPQSAKPPVPESERLAVGSLATVNGKVFFFGKTVPGDANSFEEGIVKAERNQRPQTMIKANDPVIIAGGRPKLSVYRDASFLLRASSETLVFSRSLTSATGEQIIQVFEKPNSGSLRKIYETTGGICGLATSRSNVVICVNGTILVRRGSVKEFKAIISPTPFSKTSLQPSISNETVVFKENFSGFRGVPGGEFIYVSRPNQPVQTLASAPAGPVPMGTVYEYNKLELSSNGQSINGSAVVYRYTKADSSFELRKIKLQ